MTGMILKILNDITSVEGITWYLATVSVTGVATVNASAQGPVITWSFSSCPYCHPAQELKGSSGCHRFPFPWLSVAPPLPSAPLPHVNETQSSPSLLTLLTLPTRKHRMFLL